MRKRKKATNGVKPTPNPPKYIAFLQETLFIQKFETKYNTGWKGQLFHTFSYSVLVRLCQFILEKTLMLKLSM